MELARGFQLTGDIAQCHAHRAPEEPRGGSEINQCLGQPAVDFIDELEAITRPHQHAELILEATNEEISLGLANPYQARGELDEHFGHGRWRPLPRHLVFQGGKHRPIDDGRRAGHNAAARLEETIVCQTGEFMPLAAKRWVARVL